MPERKQPSAYMRIEDLHPIKTAIAKLKANLGMGMDYLFPHPDPLTAVRSDPGDGQPEPLRRPDVNMALNAKQQTQMTEEEFAQLIHDMMVPHGQ